MPNILGINMEAGSLDRDESMP